MALCRLLRTDPSRSESGEYLCRPNDLGQPALESNDRPNHVVKKSVCHDFQPDELSRVPIRRLSIGFLQPQRAEILPSYGDLFDGPNAAGLIRPVRLEAAEIVLSNQL